MLLEPLQFPKMGDWKQSSIDIQRVESLAFCPARDIGMKTSARFHQGARTFSGSRLAVASICFTIDATLCFATGKSQ